MFHSVKQRHYVGAVSVQKMDKFGRKMDEIVKFSTLNRKMEFTVLDGIWTEVGKWSTGHQKKLSNSLTFIGFTIMFLHLV